MIFLKYYFENHYSVFEKTDNKNEVNHLACKELKILLIMYTKVNAEHCHYNPQGCCILCLWKQYSRWVGFHIVKTAVFPITVSSNQYTAHFYSVSMQIYEFLWSVLFRFSFSNPYPAIIFICFKSVACSYMGLVKRKPVFGVSNKASFKPVSLPLGTS